jgi:mRNA-degrading endonuclease toxin of MazEF toxin-antitoxin module
LSVATDMPQALFAMITTVQRSGTTRIHVKRQSLEGRTMGLTYDSIIQCDVVHAIQFRLASKPIGHCLVMAQVDEALRVAFGLKA